MNLVVVVGLRHCDDNPCEVGGLGEVYYAGTFNPSYQPPVEIGVYQNFSVTVDTSFEAGPAVISVPYAMLIGVSVFSNFVNHSFNGIDDVR